MWIIFRWRRHRVECVGACRWHFVPFLVRAKRSIPSRCRYFRSVAHLLNGISNSSRAMTVLSAPQNCPIAHAGPKIIHLAMETTPVEHVLRIHGSAVHHSTDE